MAILFRILFTLGLLILHVSVLSAQTQVNRNGPETPLKFVSTNPGFVLASTVKNSPTYLNCHVSKKIDAAIRNDLDRLWTSFYHEPPLPQESMTNPDPDQDYFDEPDIVTQEEIQKQYRKQYEDNQKKLNSMLSSNNSVDIAPTLPSRVRRSVSETMFFEWLRNDEIVISSNGSRVLVNNEYTLFANGTLKFQAVANLTTGEYRCHAGFKTEKFVIGPMVSTATMVEIASLIYDSNGRNLTIFEGEAAVINCPVKSIPEANYTWHFNNNILSFDASRQNDIRHFLLSNGSLLIVNSGISDSGKYRCNATNQFTKKLYRPFLSMLSVVSRPGNNHNRGSDLLPQLQRTEQKIKSGQNLILHCASHTNKIVWTFTPRTSDIPISLHSFNNELKYVNVSVAKHDGIYNCSSERDFQLFNVTVVTPPVFIVPVVSISTSVSASSKFNCSVSGNPQPLVEWYKNGKRIPNNHVKYFEYPIAKIETVDPEDEGLYQCMARNDYGEVSKNYYLHVRPTTLLLNAPLNAECYPMDNNKMFVTFKKESQSNKIQYFIATDNPRNFHTEVTKEINVESLVLDANRLGLIKPLTPFYLYMRNMVPNDNHMMVMSKLSKPIRCATQGITPKFVKPNSTGIFLRWDSPSADLNLTGYTIQFLNNVTSSQVNFEEEAIGSYDKFPLYVSWEDVDKNLSRIPVELSNTTEWMEVRVPGNVTGLLIINIEEIYVRILGSVMEGGEIFEQDLRYLNFTNIKSSSMSLEPLWLENIDSRGVEVHWRGLKSIKCAYMCSVSKSTINFVRGEDKFKCEKIHPISANMFDLRNLKPATSYEVFIRNCDKVMVSAIAKFETTLDAPGPPQMAKIYLENGIVLRWDPPHNPNGPINHYIMEWTFKNVTHQKNVTELSFKFPNTTNTDRFNITVRAFGSSGIVGIPLIINPDKWNGLPNIGIGSAEQQKTKNYVNKFLIFTILFISLILIVLVVAYILCRRNRYCKNSSNNGIINSEQSSFQPTTSPLTETIRSEEMYEMQTLIPTSQLVMANGRDVPIKPENPSNGGINISGNQKILRTSTPTDDTIDRMCIELPPIKCDEGLAIQIDEMKANGFIDNFTVKLPPPPTDGKELRNGSLKVNGNSSPYKCFQPSGNDQNTSSASSSFDSHRQLIETNLCNGLNNNNNVNDRSKIGKSSSIETDNEEEDSEENLHEYDLNDSNLSSKPLHPMSWDFRRPLVGPNG